MTHAQKQAIGHKVEEADRAVKMLYVHQAVNPDFVTYVQQAMRAIEDVKRELERVRFEG